MSKLLVMICAVLPLLCFSGPTRGVSGARGVSFLNEARGDSYTASDYIQDGLVAMWDGIENIGLGMHDSTSQTWVDLTGNGLDLTVNLEYSTWLADGLTCDGLHHAARRQNAQADVRAVTTHIGTVEVVFYDYKNGSFVVGLTYLNTQNYINFYRYYYERVGTLYRRNCPVTRKVSSFSCSYSLMTVDGVDVGAIVQTSAIGGGGVVASDILIGGGNIYSNTGNVQYPYGGIVKAVRVYNRDLTYEEVMANWVVGKARFGL